MICSRCGFPVEWANEWGLWIHKGGGAIMQFCPDCKRLFNKERPVSACPFCGVKGNLKDDHFAAPKREYKVEIKPIEG